MFLEAFRYINISVSQELPHVRHLWDSQHLLYTEESDAYDNGKPTDPQPHSHLCQCYSHQGESARQSSALRIEA